MAPHRKPRVAFVYDFDGTLSPGNMQEYDFIPQLGLKPSAFWGKVREQARQDEADEILAYMYLMLRKADQEGVQVLRKSFRDFGRGVDLFPGVPEWFDRINGLAKDQGLKAEHYIVSSGIREMIEGTSVASRFEKIYASSFGYDQHHVAKWPALAVNYTTKTQFLFRINKGALDVWDNSTINEYVPDEDRPIPFENIVYIGDGTTDVPCMKLVKEQGGYSIAVYRPRSSLDTVRKLVDQGRVNFVAPADYSAGKRLDQIAGHIIAKVSAMEHLKRLARDTKLDQPRLPPGPAGENADGPHVP